MGIEWWGLLLGYSSIKKRWALGHCNKTPQFVPMLSSPVAIGSG